MGMADAERVRSELALSSARLNEELGQTSRLFAYPFGGRAHMTSTALRLVQEAGFSCCVSSCGGLNAVTPDPFHLNRISIATWFKTPHQFGYEYVAGKLDRDVSYPGADQISAI
jgi:peptidoglycan/xylan/chitin deacetylase (PgdA/CDA1 family)